MIETTLLELGLDEEGEVVMAIHAMPTAQLEPMRRALELAMRMVINGQLREAVVYGGD